MLKRMFKYALVGILVLGLSACGGQDESITVPQPTDPTNQNDGGDLDPPTIPGPDGRLPDLTKAVPMLLADGLNGLTDIFNFVVPPLVGDPLVLMNISGGRSNVVTGSILVVFEDAVGFGGAQLNSFEEVGVRTSNYIDMIFADDELVLRAVTFFSGDDLNGTVYYRVRQAGENQCKKIIVNCFGNPFCNPNPDVETPCRNYMNLGNSAVEELGTFNANYADWVQN